MTDKAEGAAEDHADDGGGGTDGVIHGYVREIVETNRRLNSMAVKVLRDATARQDLIERHQRNIEERMERLSKMIDELTRPGGRRAPRAAAAKGGGPARPGKLAERMVKGDVVRLLRDFDMETSGRAPGRSRKESNPKHGFDIVVEGDTEVVVVGVKATLKKRDVEDFVKRLDDFTELFPEYVDRSIYGAVAFLEADRGTSSLSQKKGLFVITTQGGSASIVNPKGFTPKTFSR